MFLFFKIYFKRVGGKERERGKRGEAREKRNIDWLPPVHAPIGDRTCNLGMCPDW